MKPLQTEGSCKQSLITGNIFFFQNCHFVLPEVGTLAQQHVGDTPLIFTPVHTVHLVGDIKLRDGPSDRLV
jgi:hypothetical protein